ncbi:hypothetical protein HY571_01530, partial [Candidatus Micrarchaeota archaeon]|nr:hypothetical protein [Candidatus Micrarchaeota archaeon]
MVQAILAAYARAIELLKQKKQGEYPSLQHSPETRFTREFLQRELGVRAGIVELRHPHVKRVMVQPGEKRSTFIEVERIPREKIEALLRQRGYRLVQTNFHGRMVTAI